MKTNKDYLNKFKEWQNHQYDPGHYTGGKVPPMLTNPGKPVRLAWFLIIQAAIFLPASIVAAIYVSTLTKENIIPLLIPFFVFFVMGILYIIIGIRLLKQSKRKIRIGKNKIITISIILGSVLIILLVNSLFLVRKTTATINDPNNVVTHYSDVYSDRQNKIVLNDEITLRCTAYDCNYVNYVKYFSKGFVPIAIIYRWNVLTPNKGRVLGVHLATIQDE